MRHYELVTILSPMLSQDQSSEAWAQINAFITNRNGDIFQEQPWGTRRLAYPIHRGTHHFLEGNYRLIRFSTETPFNQALENFLRMDERVLRSLVIALPGRELLPDPAAARQAPAPPAATRPAEGSAAPPAEPGTAEPPATAESAPATASESPVAESEPDAPAESAAEAPESSVAEPEPAAADSESATDNAEDAPAEAEQSEG